MNGQTASSSVNNALSPPNVSKNPKLSLPQSCDPPGPNNPPKPLVWMVFGATGHIGRSIVRAALMHKDKVTAVGRTFENTMTSMQGWNEEGNCLGLLCDVRVRDTVREVIEASIRRWGHIDIIANCTGHGVIGSCEDQDEYEIRNQWETNFMGTLNIIQLSLPHFRERSAGRYLIFSSTSGALGVPGLGPYCATKYAVEGLIESMLYEIDTFSIKATLVEPGYVRRDDKPPNNSQSAHPPLPTYGHFFVKPASQPYNTPTAPAAHAKRILQWIGEKQPTSAIKAAELVWQLGHCSYPPLRLLLGTYAVESIRDRLRSIIEEIEDWKHLNFPVDGKSDDKSKQNQEQQKAQQQKGKEDKEDQDEIADQDAGSSETETDPNEQDEVDEDGENQESQGDEA